MEAILFIGIQASGKTTFYKERFFKTHIRVNLDMLKTRHRESLLLKACIEMKQPFVVDNTNPKTGEAVTAQRRRIKVDLDLPMKEDYSKFIEERITEAIYEA